MKKLHYLNRRRKLFRYARRTRSGTSRNGTEITQDQSEATVRDFFKSTVGE